MTSQGFLRQDIEANTLEVADGAVLVGRCMVGDSSKLNGRSAKSAEAKSATPVQQNGKKPKAASRQPEVAAAS